ncbi:hypothetical protein EBQ93_00815, partial [bacterium]|nr:hypothetical protein [bacterium]
MNIKSLLLCLGLCGNLGLQVFAYEPQIYKGVGEVTWNNAASFLRWNCLNYLSGSDFFGQSQA